MTFGARAVSYLPDSARWLIVTVGLFALGLGWWRINDVESLALYGVLIIGGTLQTESDIRTRLIPRMTTFVMGAFAIAVLAARGNAFLPVVLIAGTVGLALWLTHRLAPHSLGFGDVLLAPVIAMYVGWYEPTAVPLWLGGAALGAGVGAIGTRQRRVAFVPWMVISAVATIIILA